MFNLCAKTGSATVVIFESFTYYLSFFLHLLDLFQFFSYQGYLLQIFHQKSSLHWLCWWKRCCVCMGWAGTRWCSSASSAVLKCLWNWSSGVAQQRHSCFVSFPGDGLQLAETAALRPSLFECSVSDNDLAFYLLGESRVWGDEYME